MSRKHRMESMASIVGQREQAAKAAMKKSYEKTTTCKEYPPGSMALIHVTQLMGQREDSWECSYEVTQKASQHFYQIAIPGRTNILELHTFTY